jgi:signal peptidase II
VLELRYAENTDTAFSLLSGIVGPDPRWLLLSLISTLVAVGLSLLIVRRWTASTPLERVAAAMLMGGALGNVLDRWLRGHVVDFIHVQRWPIFNLADVAISVGVVLFVLGSRGREPPRALGSDSTPRDAPS